MPSYIYVQIKYKLQSEIMIDGQKLTIAVLQEKKDSEL